MKSILSYVAVLLFSSNAFASVPVLKDVALKALLNGNLTAEDGQGNTEKIGSLLASFIVSNFDSAGKGNLAVVTSECKTTDTWDIFDCTLHVLDSDREIRRGAYVPAPAMTESSLTIFYKYDSVAGKVSGPVTFFRAG